MENKEGNELIAIFMGIKDIRKRQVGLIGSKLIVSDKGEVFFSVYKIEYDTNYNELIEVLDKIKKDRGDKLLIFENALGKTICSIGDTILKNNNYTRHEHIFNCVVKYLKRTINSMQTK